MIKYKYRKLKGMIIMKVKTTKVLCLLLAMTLLLGTFFSSAIISSAAVEPTTDVTEGNKIGLEKENGAWVYYGSNKKVDKSYVGLAKNQYGWWFIKNGTIDFSYTGTANNI